MMKLNTVAMATLALMSGIAMNAEAAASRDGSKVYIVQMKEEPAATYQGTTDGYPATQPVPGTAFQSRSRATIAYSGYLRSKQLALLSTVSSASVISQFDTVINGFTARLTPAQAAALSVDPSVAMVAEDQLLTPATVTTPTFLGLTAPGGLWSQLDPNGVAVKGEGMILGDLDLGIWPESPSYFDRVDASGAPVKTGGTLAYGPPPATWTGICVAGDSFVPATACNNKLIGARYYNTNLLAGGNVLDSTAFNSPRDDLPSLGGHGDHTASTAAGNSNVAVTLNGLAFGTASGMAPRARIAVYKVCFSYLTPGATVAINRCSTADSMAAIDQGVKDGVNAMNFSIGGSTNTTNDLVEQAFYRAAVAGVFVAAAAGNDGPANTTNHPGPWLSTVAAATHDRIQSGDITLGNNAKYTGASLNASALPLTTLIRAEDAGMGGASASLCYTSDDLSQYGGPQVLLDPAKVAGKVVICTRGTNARVNKSQAVANAGGVGMILVDNGSGLVSEVHAVPTIHVSATDGAAIKAYAVAAGTAAKAAETAFYFGSQPAPTIASFSGRGPNLADVNVLKPDMAAPGVGVVASVTPALTQAQRVALAAGTFVPGPAWASYDGTSMATPHVTGVSLLLKQAHPTWTPAAIKSAMMTTAFDTLDDGLAGMQNGKLPWSQGAGFISPNKATDPGLVYDMTKGDYVAYQCLTQKSLIAAADCTTYGTLDQTYNLNLPSITLGAMTGGAVTVKRTVTNVGSASATYTPTASLSNMSVSVLPTSLTLAPGAKANFTVTVTPNAATPKFAWQYGTLSWTDGTHVVRSPLQAYLGTSIVAPGETSSAYTTVSGSRLFTIQTGVAVTPTATKGMKAVTLGSPTTLTPNSSVDVGAVCAAATSNTNTAVYSMSVPAGTIVARFALRQADVSGLTDDNDLAVVSPTGVVTSSGGSTSHEMVELLNPAAGTYKVCVSLYAAATGSSTHKLSSWIVKPGDTVAGGAFNVLLPRSVYAGGTATVGMSWSGLATSQRYLGGAAFIDASGSAAAATPVYIDTTPGTPADLPTTTADGKQGLLH